MRCSSPIAAAVLTDYWLGSLASQEEQAVEDHLFECGECAVRMSEVAEMAGALRRLAREGSLRAVVSDEFVRWAKEEGLLVREYAPPPGGGVQCTVTAEDDILLGRLAADFTGVERVDLCFNDGRGVEWGRFEDIPFPAGAGSVVFQESITMARLLPDSKLTTRLVAVDEEGERLLGEYTFNHTRSLPGPGEWPPGAG